MVLVPDHAEGAAVSVRKINLTLDGTLDAVEGSGDALTFKVRGYRRTKAGNHEAYHLEFKACRGTVKKLLVAIDEMHTRDQARILEEKARIRSERRILKDEAE